jgi:hypothetical protein
MRRLAYGRSEIDLIARHNAGESRATGRLTDGRAGENRAMGRQSDGKAG